MADDQQKTFQATLSALTGINWSLAPDNALYADIKPTAQQWQHFDALREAGILKSVLQIPNGIVASPTEKFLGLGFETFTAAGEEKAVLNVLKDKTGIGWEKKGNRFTASRPEEAEQAARAQTAFEGLVASGAIAGQSSEHGFVIDSYDLPKLSLRTDIPAAQASEVMRMLKDLTKLSWKQGSVSTTTTEEIAGKRFPARHLHRHEGVLLTEGEFSASLKALLESAERAGVLQVRPMKQDNQLLHVVQSYDVEGLRDFLKQQNVFRKQAPHIAAILTSFTQSPKELHEGQTAKYQWEFDGLAVRSKDATSWNGPYYTKAIELKNQGVLNYRTVFSYGDEAGKSPGGSYLCVSEVNYAQLKALAPEVKAPPSAAKHGLV